jgi:hypothetical protein
MSKVTRLKRPTPTTLKEAIIVNDGYTVVIAVEVNHIQVVNGQTNVLGNTKVQAFGTGSDEFSAYNMARERGISDLENALSQMAADRTTQIVKPD